MPFPRQRSTSQKKKTHRTPSGRVSTLYAQGKGSKHSCAICHAIQSAVMVRSKALKRATKTQRRPERKFGGVLCASCVETLIKEKTRLETGSISREEVSLAHLKYLDRLKA